MSPTFIEEIRRLSTLYHQSILGHNNRLAVEISNPPNVRRTLRTQGPSDLPQPADDEDSSAGPVGVSSVEGFST
jgi:hypothetical protein